MGGAAGLRSEHRRIALPDALGGGGSSGGQARCSRGECGLAGRGDCGRVAGALGGQRERRAAAGDKGLEGLVHGTRSPLRAADRAPLCALQRPVRRRR